ncbi:MAG: hypothetical protein JKY53_10735 [Flavobacteriales bacterium]|nr:hypothetical protein [Flavobacteriales bacterium]
MSIASKTILNGPIEDWYTYQFYNTSCSEYTNGNVIAYPEGFLSPIQSTIWTNSNNDTVGVNVVYLTSVEADEYTCHVTYYDGCESERTYHVRSPDTLKLTMVDITNSTCRFNDGSVEVNLTGGWSLNNYSYQIAGNVYTTDLITGLASGLHTIIAGGSPYCFDTLVVFIESDSDLKFDVNTSGVTCGLCDGTGSVTVVNQNGPSTYLWNATQTSTTVTGLCGLCNVSCRRFYRVHVRYNVHSSKFGCKFISG